MVVNAVKGVEVGTEIISRHVRNLNKPMIFVINQLDREKANFEQTLEHAQASFGKKVVLVQYPVNQGLGFNQVVDVLKMEMYQWKPEGGKPDVLPIPSRRKRKPTNCIMPLIEAAAENDEGLMELYFEKGSLSEDEMRRYPEKGWDRPWYVPCVLCVGRKGYVCTAFYGIPVNVAPSAAAMPGMLTKDGRLVPYEVNGPASALYSVRLSSSIWEISTYFKVVSGTVKEGDDLINMTTGY